MEAVETEAVETEVVKTEVVETEAVKMEAVETEAVKMEAFETEAMTQGKAVEREDLAPLVQQSVVQHHDFATTSSLSYQVPLAVLQCLFLPPQNPSFLLSSSHGHLILLSKLLVGQRNPPRVITGMP